MFAVNDFNIFNIHHMIFFNDVLCHLGEFSSFPLVAFLCSETRVFNAHNSCLTDIDKIAIQTINVVYYVSTFLDDPYRFGKLMA
jgi:hypothetical protein